jgi:predicted enzyme related to lactoylglutathione lyase
MALDKVQIATVWVNDLDHALHFYTHVLRLKKRADMRFGEGQRWLTVAPRADDVEIALQPAERGEVGRFTGIVFGSADPERTASELKARGVEFTQEPERRECGAVMAQFRDPDGNVFVLHSAQAGGD